MKFIANVVMISFTSNCAFNHPGMTAISAPAAAAASARAKQAHSPW